MDGHVGSCGECLGDPCIAPAVVDQIERELNVIRGGVGQRFDDVAGKVR
jgi:hypothetical protein